MDGAFALTGHTLRVMERLAAGVVLNEGVLLVGESGTGKTTMVQRLASQVCFYVCVCVL